jgi:hypothetical protein
MLAWCDTEQIVAVKSFVAPASDQLNNSYFSTSCHLVVLKTTLVEVQNKRFENVISFKSSITICFQKF